MFNNFFDGSGNNNNNHNNNNNAGGIFQAIVEKANKTTNSEEAKKIRKSLITYGGIGMGVGILLIIIAIITFASSIMSFDFENRTEGGIVAGFLMFFIDGIILAISSAALQAGIKIVIVGVGTNILDVSNKCPNCGDIINSDESFCDKCGIPLYHATLCECGKQNDINSTFCKSCGKKLR